MNYTFSAVQGLIRDKAIKYGLDLRFFDRIIEIESDYNPLAVNHLSGARGLGQLMPVVVQEYENFTGNDVYNLFDADENLEISAWYLGKRIPQMLRAYEKPLTARNIAWAYNAGIGRVVKNYMPGETIEYIEKLGSLVDRPVAEKKNYWLRIHRVTFLPFVKLLNSLLPLKEKTPFRLGLECEQLEQSKRHNLL